MIKRQGLATPKTIILCNTMTNVASMVGNLLAMLGNALYVPGRPQVPENKVQCSLYFPFIDTFQIQNESIGLIQK